MLLESGKASILLVTYTQSDTRTRTATDIIPVFISDRFLVFAKETHSAAIITTQARKNSCPYAYITRVFTVV